MTTTRSCSVKLLRITQRVVTGKPQGVRALASADPETFRDYLLESEQFSTLALVLVADVPFDAAAASEELLSSRDFGSQSSANREELQKLVRMINSANIAREMAWEHAGTRVTEDVHASLLRRLWSNLTGGEKQIGEWTRLGFQNKLTPYSDFRSEGLLALHCLLAAREILGERTESIMSRSEIFGFATLSVNVTNWVRLMLMDKREKLIDKLFYFDPNEFDRSPQSICLGVFAWLHWRVFEAFLDFWETYGYPSVLSFGPVSEEFKGGLARVVSSLKPPVECYEGTADYLI